MKIGVKIGVALGGAAVLSAGIAALGYASAPPAMVHALTLGASAAILVLLLFAGNLVRRENRRRVQAEESLRLSQQRYQLLFEKSPHPAWVYDVETLAIRDANEAALENYGYTREEFLKLSIKDLRPEEEIPALLWDVTVTRDRPESQGIWRHRKRNGEIITAEVTSHPLTYCGRHARIVVATDISRREHAEDVLRQSEEKLRLLVSSVKDYAIFMLDAEGRVQTWNAGAERAKGYRAEEIIGQHFSRFFPPEDQQTGKPDALLKQAADSGRAEDCGWRVRGDGSRFWADVLITALRDPDGELRGFAKISRDMSERHRIEAALQASEERFRNVANAANDAIISADSSGRVTYANRAAERIFGWSADEMNGQPLAILMPERFREAHLRGFARFLQTGEAVVLGKTVELAGLRKDGAEFPLELSLSMWKTQEGVFFSGILRDITERKRWEEELRLRNAQLAAANQELESFSYSVSHDLRAPLRGIDGFSLALAEDYAEQLDAAARDYLARIRAAAQRMAALIDDLLQLARIARSELRRERVDLSQIAKAVSRELRASAPGRQAEFVIEDGLEDMGDSRLLRVALENLLGNAWKYTSKHPSARIEFGKEKWNGAQTYFVRDDGAGFDPAHARQLFGAFQRLHNEREFPGSGIGLATVKRIIQRHGGRVWAEGDVEKGATFYFTL